MIEPYQSDDNLLTDIQLARSDRGKLHIWWLGQSGFLIQWNGKHLGKGKCGPITLKLHKALQEKIKAATAASENYGNFYGQNLAPVQAGILLVYGVMKGLGYDVSLWDLVKYTVPVVAASLILGFIQFALLDRSIHRDSKGAK